MKAVIKLGCRTLERQCDTEKRRQRFAAGLMPLAISPAESSVGLLWARIRPGMEGAGRITDGLRSGNLKGRPPGWNRNEHRQRPHEQRRERQGVHARRSVQRGRQAMLTALAWTPAVTFLPEPGLGTLARVLVAGASVGGDGNRSRSPRTGSCKVRSRGVGRRRLCVVRKRGLSRPVADATSRATSTAGAPGARSWARERGSRRPVRRGA